MTTTTTLQTLTSLCRRRGFLFQSSEIYGGLASTWDYGPLGVELKNNVKRHWWQTFVWGRRDMVGLDAAILMHPEVWRASGHVENFTDPSSTAAVAASASAPTTSRATPVPTAARPAHSPRPGSSTLCSRPTSAPSSPTKTGSTSDQRPPRASS